MLKSWHETAWNDYLWWQANDRAVLKRVNRLIQDIERNGTSTTGHPEPLSNELAGWWSVRIDKANRLVFAIKGDVLEIYACKGHYN